MKKQWVICAVLALNLTACADKKNYEAAVLEDVKKEKDLETYHIEPEHMADCVIDTTYQKMPGFFPFHPDRLVAYRNYAKMLSVAKSSDPKKTLEELRKEFGSPQELAKAHSIYTESVMDCFSAITQETESETQSVIPKEPKG